MEPPHATGARSTGTAFERLSSEIGRQGPISFSRFMEVALYEENVGFFALGGGAGRAGRDFMTSPEVGPLYGECVARALDRWWEADGRPDPFLVVEVGAGDGRLAREVLRAEPACTAALRYLLVECSPVLRAAQHERLTLEPAQSVMGAVVPGDEEELEVVRGRGPLFGSLSELPAAFEGVLFANELLDNLPVDVAEFDGEEWHEVRVGVSGAQLAEVLVPVTEPPYPFGSTDLSAGTRVPVPVGLTSWLARVGAALRHGRAVLVDYVVSAAEVAGRSPAWLRSYRAHTRGLNVLAEPGAADITADVVSEQLDRAAEAAGLRVVASSTQARWLRQLGMEDLVSEGARTWEQRAHVGDLAAIAGRSRGVEAATLTDLHGLGGFRVVELEPASR